MEADFYQQIPNVMALPIPSSTLSWYASGPRPAGRTHKVKPVSLALEAH